MRIKVHCQNRIGILRDILDLLVAYGVNVARGEVGGEHGDAIYLHCPNLINLQFQALRPKFEAITGVFGVKRVGLMPSERRHMELNALLGALEFPVLSIDMVGAIVAANRAAAQLLGVRVDEVPGIPLSRYAEDFDLPELVRASKSRINGAEIELFGYDPGAFEGARLEGRLGLLELTAGGTLFLDGVGELSARMQAKLLRFIQDGSFRRVGSDEDMFLDVRVVCSTQVDLSELCFRQDLYHRLNVLSLHIPPLAPTAWTAWNRWWSIFSITPAARSVARCRA